MTDQRLGQIYSLSPLASYMVVVLGFIDLNITTSINCQVGGAPGLGYPGHILIDHDPRSGSHVMSCASSNVQYSDFQGNSAFVPDFRLQQPYFCCFTLDCSSYVRPQSIPTSSIANALLSSFLQMVDYTSQILPCIRRRASEHTCDKTDLPDT